MKIAFVIILIVVVVTIATITNLSISNLPSTFPKLALITRTGRREKCFNKLLNSIRQQTFLNFEHILSNDNPNCSYLNDYRNESNVKVIEVAPHREKKCFYNLYFNDLFAHVSPEAWIVLVDDDSMLHDRTSLQKLAYFLNGKSPNTLVIQDSYLYGNKDRFPQQSARANNFFLNVDTSNLVFNQRLCNNIQLSGNCEGDKELCAILHNNCAAMERFNNCTIWANYCGENKGKYTDCECR